MAKSYLVGIFCSTCALLMAAGWAEGQGEAPAASPESGEARLGRVERALAEGRATAQRIQGLMDESRRERDLIRMTCLSDKLAQFNAGLANLEVRTSNLKDALRAGDDSRAGHESTVAGVIIQKNDVLAREVNQCVGQDLYETGDTKTEVSFVGDVPGGDPTVLFQAGPHQVPLVPPPASPIR